MDDVKRLFWAFEVQAPWPEIFPEGRILEERFRHITAACLGNVSQKRVLDLVHEMPRPPPFKVADVGMFEACVSLPPSIQKGNCVAWKGRSMGKDRLTPYVETLTQFFREKGFSIEPRPFLNHVTIARAPFKEEEWKKAFDPLPYRLRGLHLYESLGHLRYRSLWSASFLPPFEPLDHVADLAFEVRGEDVNQLYIHAQVALAFEYPELLPYLDEKGKVETLEGAIIKLNEIVTQADEEIGIPFKALSFHGRLVKKETIFTWKMIVDV